MLNKFILFFFYHHFIYPISKRHKDTIYYSAFSIFIVVKVVNSNRSKRRQQHVNKTKTNILFLLQRKDYLHHLI